MRLLFAALALTLSGASLAATCTEAAFVDTIAESAWVNLDLTPTQGTRGVRDALRQAQSQHPAQPVRIRLAPGAYADNLGGEIFAQRLLRTAANPIWLQATDPRPNATVLGQGLNLLGVSYLAIEGLTIGPETVGAWNGSAHADPQPLQAAAGIHVAGAAKNGRANANQGGVLNPAVYGQFEPSHHILVRRVTIQNLFGRDERDGETSESQNMDGMKFNQVTDLWVLDSSVRQTTRHGIDNVGVHRAAFCRNVVAQSGGGLGIEAKGGSVDVLYESNTFYRVRRVELGGEDTDATYYFSADGRWDYEALRTVARNNLIVDAREAAMEFSGCQDCVAVGNSVVFTAGYQAPSAGGEVFGGDALRAHDSRVLAAPDGAGSDCQTWDESAQDYVTVDPCWGVGANAPAPINRVLRNANPTVVNNLFSAEGGSFGRGGGAVVPCPLNASGGNAPISFNANYWWNGGQALPVATCSPLSEGAASRFPGGSAPIVGGALDASSTARLTASILDALAPRAGSPLLGMAIAHPSQAAYDRLGAPRGNAVGALVNVDARADRVFSFAERFYPQFFPGHVPSTVLSGYYVRHYPAAQNYIGAANGRLYLLGPSLTGGQVQDYGALDGWMATVRAAGH